MSYIAVSSLRVPLVTSQMSRRLGQRWLRAQEGHVQHGHAHGDDPRPQGLRLRRRSQQVRLEVHERNQENSKSFKLTKTSICEWFQRHQESAR